MSWSWSLYVAKASAHCLLKASQFAQVTSIWLYEVNIIKIIILIKLYSIRLESTIHRIIIHDDVEEAELYDLKMDFFAFIENINPLTR